MYRSTAVDNQSPALANGAFYPTACVFCHLCGVLFQAKLLNAWQELLSALQTNKKKACKIVLTQSVNFLLQLFVVISPAFLKPCWFVGRVFMHFTSALKGCFRVLVEMYRN